MAGIRRLARQAAAPPPVCDPACQEHRRAVLDMVNACNGDPECLRALRAELGLGQPKVNGTDSTKT